MSIIVRRLTLDDINEYKEIRLEMLKLAPSSFGSSFEEESLFEDEMWINRLSKKTIKVLGAYEEGSLAGILLIVKNPRKKMKHIATINSVFVREEYRGRGIASTLLSSAISCLNCTEVERVKLSVVTINEHAIKLYESHGFNVYGTDKDSIKIDNDYYDQLLMEREISCN